MVRSRDRVILIDVGVGPHDRPGTNATVPGGKMLDNLKASGTALEEITDCLFSHLHAGHIALFQFSGGASGVPKVIPHAGSDPAACPGK